MTPGEVPALTPDDIVAIREQLHCWRNVCSYRPVYLDDLDLLSLWPGVAE